MLYVHAAVLFTQDMATPKEMVDDRLAELGWSKTEFAKKLGYTTYQGYHDLFGSQRTKLTDEKLAQIAEVLEWPRDHFKDPNKTIEREEFVRKTFAKYMRSEVGLKSDAETNKILESMRWVGKFLPSVRLYQAVALAMEGKYTPEQLVGALELAEADEASEGTVLPDEAPARISKRNRKHA